MFPISDSIKSYKFPVANFAIIIFTSFVFIEELLSPNTDVFIAKFALTPANVNFENLKTLTPFITAIFIHGGFLHILTNMWFLWIFGDNVETSFGSLPYIIFYLISGIIANLTQYIFMTTSNTPMLGASGSIAGVMGAYYLLFPRSKIKTIILIVFIPFIINIPATIMLIYWFLIQLISGAVSLIPNLNITGGIAFFAHVGGFITGLIFGRIFTFPLQHR